MAFFTITIGQLAGSHASTSKLQNQVWLHQVCEVFSETCWLINEGWGFEISPQRDFIALVCMSFTSRNSKSEEEQMRVRAREKRNDDRKCCLGQKRKRKGTTKPTTSTRVSSVQSKYKRSVTSFCLPIKTSLKSQQKYPFKILLGDTFAVLRSW